MPRGVAQITHIAAGARLQERKIGSRGTETTRWRRPTLAISWRNLTGSGRCSSTSAATTTSNWLSANGSTWAAGMQEPGAGVLAPVGPQPGVGQVQGDHLTPAPVQLVGDHALAAADLQGPRRRAAGFPADLAEHPVPVGHPALGEQPDGLRAVYLWLWLPMTTPTVSGASFWRVPISRWPCGARPGRRAGRWP
jgi:hypothetical protein